MTDGFIDTFWFDPAASGASLECVVGRARLRMVLYRSGNNDITKDSWPIILRNGSATGDIRYEVMAQCTADVTVKLKLISGNEKIAGDGILFEDGIWFTNAVNTVFADSCTLIFSRGG